MLALICSLIMTKKNPEKSKQQFRSIGLLMFKFLPVITGTKLKLQCWEHCGSQILSFWSFFLSSPHRWQWRRKDKWIWASGPGSFIWRTGQLMDVLPGSGWELKHLPGPLVKALGLALNVLYPRELMLKGTLAVPSAPVLKCQCKKGRAEGRGMP